MRNLSKKVVITGALLSFTAVSSLMVVPNGHAQAMYAPDTSLEYMEKHPDMLSAQSAVVSNGDEQEPHGTIMNSKFCNIGEWKPSIQNSRAKESLRRYSYLSKRDVQIWAPIKKSRKKAPTHRRRT